MAKTENPTGKPLANMRDERYCQFLAAGYPQLAAYGRAGFSTKGVGAAGNAYQKAHQPKIAKRTAEIRAHHAKELGITVEGLTAELDAAIALAWAVNQPAAAHAAIMGKAKLHGLITDKSLNVNVNAFADLSEEEVDFEIASMIGEFKSHHEKKKAIKPN